ncbi:MAG: murein biosynthesis integral membrane protein MurJ [Burkholderiaceae bacterium]|nr:murein biosynthesis integral membrane protein MurJ [Burkholderiaceae bacterium]MEB2320774.1 murein biosynthesis integral membrane protein MurJ [Pseudomonadota bacterium]
MNLLRAAATVSGLTLLSRITGLIRENLVAAIFGASAHTDAFFVAFRLPNLLRRMFAEGAFSQAFVPILADVRERTEREGDPGQIRLLVDRVATALFWTVLLVSILGAAAAPALVWLMASGLARDPATFEVATTLTRWMFPYILFVSMVALSAGILNTWRRFMVPAFAPVLLNLCFIGAALLLTPWFDPPIYALGAGVVLGGIAQLAIQIPALHRIGVLPRIGFGLRAAFTDPDTRRILKLMGPAVLAVSVAQLSLIINTHIASRLAEGSVSWVSFGDRLMEFPTALLGVALGTVLLPSLSRARAENATERYSQMLDWGLRLSVMLAIPCMIGLATLAEPLTALLFHYGRFTADDVEMTRRAVLGYSLGLLGLIAVKVLAPGFYAHLDVRTPVKIAIAVLVMTQMMNIAFVPLFAHAGLALSISVGATLNALMLLIGLRRRRSYVPQPGWLRFGLQVGVAAAAMAALLLWVEPRFDWIALQATPFRRIGLVLGLVAAAAAVYLGTLLAVGIRPRQFLRREDN